MARRGCGMGRELVTGRLPGGWFEDARYAGSRRDVMEATAYTGKTQESDGAGNVSGGASVNEGRWPSRGDCVVDIRGPLWCGSWVSRCLCELRLLALAVVLPSLATTT